MTHAAKAFGKDVRDFLYAPSTQEYEEALSNCGNFPQLKESRPGRYGGTWAHPKLAVFFARWLDVRFAVWCDAMAGTCGALLTSSSSNQRVMVRCRIWTL